MNNVIFPIISELETRLPFFLHSIGCHYTQEQVTRPSGFPYLQWIQCKQGIGALSIEGQLYTLCPNQGMLLPPHVPHMYYSLESPWIVDWISIGGLSVEAFWKHALVEKYGVFSIAYTEKLSSTLEKIISIAHSQSAMKIIENSKIIYDFLLDLLTYTSISSHLPIPHYSSKLTPVFGYINTNYNTLLTLEELAAAASLTPEYLCHLFKETTGLRVFEYINTVRIKNSKMFLLQNKNSTIKEIATLCGFQDSSYFCSVFKKIEHMTPGEFRKMY